jgi:hypothetical protein
MHLPARYIQSMYRRPPRRRGIGLVLDQPSAHACNPRGARDPDLGVFDRYAACHVERLCLDCSLIGSSTEAPQPGRWSSSKFPLFADIVDCGEGGGYCRGRVSWEERPGWRWPPTVIRLASEKRRPPKTPADLANDLAKSGVPSFADRLRTILDQGAWLPDHSPLQIATPDVTCHQWQALYPTEIITGTSRRRASANASGPQLPPVHRVGRVLEQVRRHRVPQPVHFSTLSRPARPTMIREQRNKTETIMT